jgi:hypothetical protein
LPHATWEILNSDMTPFGTSVRGGDSFCQFDTTLYPPIIWQLYCGTPDVGPPFTGFYLRAVTGTGFEAAMWPAVLVGPEPTYMFSDFYGTRPPLPVYVRWLPGP